jgi:hypothetical protein
MIDERWDGLIQEEMDGVATPTDRALLYDRLARDPDVRAAYEEMQRLAGAIRNVPREEPPASLKIGVMNAIGHDPSHTAVPAHASRRGLWAGFRDAFVARPVWGGGFVFATGIAVGLLLFALVGHSPVLDTQGLTGAMTPTEHFERLGHKNIDFNGVRGQLETGLSSQGPCFYIDLQSPQPCEISIGFLGQPNAFRGFHQENPANGQVRFDAGGLRIQNSGKNRYLLTEAPAGQNEILVRIQVGEATLEERLPLIR